MITNIRTKLLQVRPFQETLNGGYCGPATLKIVLDYYGIQKIADRCGQNPKLGIDDVSIKKAAEFYGFIAEIKNRSNFNDIQRWLKKKVPVIVDWFTRGRSDYDNSQVPDGHYSVVIGLDKGNIYLQDPEIGAIRTFKREDFFRVWFDFKADHITSWKDMIIRQLIAIYPKHTRKL